MKTARNHKPFGLLTPIDPPKGNYSLLKPFSKDSYVRKDEPKPPIIIIINDGHEEYEVKSIQNYKKLRDK